MSIQTCEWKDENYMSFHTNARGIMTLETKRKWSLKLSVFPHHIKSYKNLLTLYALL